MLLELEDAIHGTVEERAVVRDHDHRAGRVVHESLEPVEAREVEVVGGLVEEEDVEPTEQDRRERGAGRLAAGERADLYVHAVGREPDVGQHGFGPRVEIGTTEREEAVERLGVRVGDGRIRGHRLGERVECVARLGHSSAAREVRAQGLAGPRVGLLREVADGQRRRRPLDSAGVWRLLPREDAQERRLADAVRPDHAEPVTGRNRERHVVEDGAPTERLRDVAGGEHARRR